MLMAQKFQAVLQGKARWNDYGECLLPDCLFDFVIGLRESQLLLPLDNPGVNGNDVRLGRFNLGQILPEDLQCAQLTQPTHALSHHRGAITIAAELQQCLKSSAMGANRVYGVCVTLSCQQLAYQTKHRGLIEGGRLS